MIQHDGSNKMTDVGTAPQNVVVFLRSVALAGGRPDSKGRSPGLRVKPTQQHAAVPVNDGWPLGLGGIPCKSDVEDEPFVIEDDGAGLYLPHGGEISIVGGDGLWNCDVLMRAGQPGGNHETGWRRTFELAAGPPGVIADVLLPWGYQSVSCNVAFYVDVTPARAITFEGLAGQVICLPPGIQRIGLHNQSLSRPAIFCLNGRL